MLFLFYHVRVESSLSVEQGSEIPRPNFILRPSQVNFSLQDLLNIDLPVWEIQAVQGGPSYSEVRNSCGHELTSLGNRHGPVGPMFVHTK